MRHHKSHNSDPSEHPRSIFCVVFLNQTKTKNRVMKNPPILITVLNHQFPSDWTSVWAIYLYGSLGKEYDSSELLHLKDSLCLPLEKKDSLCLPLEKR